MGHRKFDAVAHSSASLERLCSRLLMPWVRKGLADENRLISPLIVVAQLRTPKKAVVRDVCAHGLEVMRTMSQSIRDRINSLNTYSSSPLVVTEEVGTNLMVPREDGEGGGENRKVEAVTAPRKHDSRGAHFAPSCLFPATHLHLLVRSSSPLPPGFS